tara:strand:- start:147 stop:500 length:354 start_codon:yes stop_codon:yes gene_type:complete
MEELKKVTKEEFDKFIENQTGFEVKHQPSTAHREYKKSWIKNGVVIAECLEWGGFIYKIIKTNENVSQLLFNVTYQGQDDDGLIVRTITVQAENASEAAEKVRECGLQLKIYSSNAC